jgi:hypothetical protein
MKHTLTIAVILGALVIAACSSSSPTAPSTATSTSTSSSHNAGRDCTSCHSFTVAGTAFKSDGATVYPGAVIRLTNSGGTTVATLTADGSGNFYTSTSVAFGSGLTVTATGTSGAVKTMGSTITKGGCNSCHGSGNRVVAG